MVTEWQGMLGALSPQKEETSLSTGTVQLGLRPCPSQKNTSEKAAFLLLVLCDFHSLVAALRAIAFLKMERISSYLFLLNRFFHPYFIWSLLTKPDTHKNLSHNQEDSLIYLSLAPAMTKNWRTASAAFGLNQLTLCLCLSFHLLKDSWD